MAADLLENFQYGLSSSGLSGADKTVLLLKLTDPSLKCIEQYQKLKYSTSKRPSIQFKGNSGVITFPSTEAKDGEREFKFTVQPIQAPPTSSFESIQHYRNSRGEHKLDSLGSIQTKVTVSGTDDVYQTTHKKMRLADEEMKKVSTKEVKQDQFKPGHRVKRKSISAHVKKIISSSSTSMSASASSTNHPSVSSNPTSYSSNLSMSFNASATSSATPATSSSTSRNSHLTSSTASKSAIPGSSSSKSSSAKPGGPAGKGSGTASSSQKSAVHNRSYRDRVIHILALKPFKKPELLVKLQKDGIPSREKNQLALILSQVATLAKDNSYILHKNMFNEVSVDWPAYTEADRQLIKRRKAVVLKDTPSPPSQRSPHHAVANTPPAAAAATKSSSATLPNTKTAVPTSQKRPLLPEVKDYKTKKPRIAHSSAPKPQDPYPLPQPQLSPSCGYTPAPSIAKKVPSPAGLVKKVPSPSSTSALPSTTASTSPSSHTNQSALSSPSVSTTRNSPDCCDASGAAPATVSMFSSGAGNATRHTNSSSTKEQSSGRGEKQARATSATGVVKEDKKPVGKESPSGDVSSTSVVPEYMLKYTTILSLEQRHKFKEEFNALYPKYREHHKYIEGIKHKFKSLQDELNRTPKDSEHYEKLQDTVIEEHSKITQDPAYKEREAKWQELHTLLGHIKSLIMVYDKERLQMDTA